MNDDIRRQTGGSFVELPAGVTHYELGNPTRDHTVVLVHGFSVPYFIFDPTFQFLTRHGFRVLRYDLFGRGFSDRPQAEYNIDLFVQQLADLLDALRLTRPVNLLGLSMGGPIAAAFTARFPERVDRLILIDPAGARPITHSRLLKVVAMPGVGEALLFLAGEGVLVRSVASDIFDKKLVEHFQQLYRIQMQYRGFRRALLSTIRNNMLESFIGVYRSIGRLGTPALLLWGRHDTTVPLWHSDELRKAIPHMEFHVIQDCSHIPHYEKPEETNALLLKFLRKS
ncbi:MAG TPA: alpha/beta hydrolase [Anaerolineales bacterium]|nr:alpha/beta hydrolase [Anaerolineales bacterium]